MTTRSSRDRNLGGGEVAGIPLIAAPRASYAAAFTRAFEKSRLSPLGAPQTPRCPSSFQARTSAAEGGRLRFGSAAERRRRCRDRDQELKRDPLPCLINSAGSSTYPTRKSVRTTQATPSNQTSVTAGSSPLRSRIIRSILCVQVRSKLFGKLSRNIGKGSGVSARHARRPWNTCRGKPNVSGGTGATCRNFHCGSFPSTMHGPNMVANIRAHSCGVRPSTTESPWLSSNTSFNLLAPFALLAPLLMTAKFPTAYAPLLLSRSIDQSVSARSP